MKSKLVVLGMVVLAIVGSYRTGHRKGYVKAYKAALPVGACYGARGLAGEIGIPVGFTCPPIPKELLPDPQPEVKEEPAKE